MIGKLTIQIICGEESDVILVPRFFVFNSNLSLALRRQKCIKRQEAIIKL